MSTLNKMTIDLKEFIITGHINGIKPGISKDKFLFQHPQPDAFNSDPEDFLTNDVTMSPNIWTYGDIEFHLNTEGILFMIWCDHIGDFYGKLKGGQSIDLHRWFLEENTTIGCIELIEILNHENLDFSRSDNKHSESLELHLVNGVQFSFHLESHWSEEAEIVKNRKEETSFNNYKLSAFSLFNEDFMTNKQIN